MENQIAELTTAIAEMSDMELDEYKHPLLTKAKFIFATNEGMSLSTAPAAGVAKQGIKEEEFDEVIRTAINAPVKMQYLGVRGIGNHMGSIPIGHIISMVKAELDGGVKALVAEAMLYANEYPEEVEYLKREIAAGRPPGISYEIIHAKDSPIENGVQWLKRVVTQAATIVRSPAYGNRTAILAMASNKELTDDEFNTGVLSLITTPQGNTTSKGGSEMDEKTEKEIKDLNDRIVALAAEKEEALEAGKTLKDQLDELTNQVKSLTDENSTYKRNEVLSMRTQAFVDAGLKLDEDKAKADAKKDFWAKMDDATFTEYVADLKAASATALAQASSGGIRVPRPANSGEGNKKTYDQLKAELRARE